MDYTGAGIITTFKIKYQGETIEDYSNKHGNVEHDDVMATLLPQEVCACALGSGRDAKGRGSDGHCMRKGTVMRIARHLGVTGSESGEVMREIMRKTHCTDEKCVLAAAQKMRALSAAEAGIEEQIAFKRSGPTDSSLFSDSVIQAQLYAWMYQFPSFWAYNFNMINWNEASLRDGRVRASPDTLATVRWSDLWAGKIPMPIGLAPTPASNEMLAAKRAAGIRCSACVVNSDTYDGNGKHWMALFVDTRDKDRWTIEFFNSAAVRPESSWLEWMARTRLELQKCSATTRIDSICVCKIWHQHSKSECGPYSLFYVWARLNGVPAQYFLENVVPDQIMFEFRQHLFSQEAGAGTGAFDFAQYAKKVRVKWDTEDIRDSKKRTNI
jgi:hypothetical protein